MKSSTTPRFHEAYRALPLELRTAAKKQYRLWQKNPRHPSLQFKKVGPFWSVRVTRDFRALAVLREGTYYWFWIGPHTEYDRILNRS